MTFLDILIDNRQAIFDEWLSVTLNSYPSDTAKFFKKQKDSFSNPVGGITFDSLDKLLSTLLNSVDVNLSELKNLVDPVIRIRAVQNFNPSDAIAFIFLLKGIVGNFLDAKYLSKYANDLFVFYAAIDDLAKVAFDVYMTCREQVYELKANESRNQFFGSLSRAGLIDKS